MEAGRILIVEDEVIVSTDLKRKVGKMGYEVTGCIRYGEKALEAARTDKADLVLMDINLKGEMDGTEAAEQIARELFIPIIFMTAFSDPVSIERAKISGPYSYLTKPIRFDELKINIEMALYKAEMERKLKEKEQYFRTLIDFTYDWETWVGVDGELLYTSPSCYRITGYRKEDFERNPDLIYQLIREGSGEEAAAEFISHREDRQNRKQMEFRIGRADGTSLWLEHICQPVYSSEGQYLGRRASNRDISDRKASEEAKDKLISELQVAMDNIKTLKGLLPICSSCKKIRDDEGYWNQVEVYFSKHTGTEFTHGLCPDCARKIYPHHYKE